MSFKESNRTMHALQMVKYGPVAEAFEYNTRAPIPKLKSATEVLVRVKAAGINPVELKTVMGNMKLATFSITFPHILGADYAGIIEEVGDDVNDFKIGDEVFGALQVSFTSDGTYAQYTVVDTKVSAIALKPRHLSFEQAASAGIAVLAAYQGIIIHGMRNEDVELKKRKILIVGASGGVGGYAVQMAKAVNQNNTLVGLCSGKNTEFVKSLGADRVINYKNIEQFDIFLQEEKGTFDLIFDCVGGDDYYFKLKGLLKKDGPYCTAVGPIEHFGSDSVGPLTLVSVASKVVYRKVFTKQKYHIVTAVPFKDFKTKIAPLFEDHSIRGIVMDDQTSVFKLRDGIRALEKLLTHRTVGKLVLDCS